MSTNKSKKIMPKHKIRVRVETESEESRLDRKSGDSVQSSNVVTESDDDVEITIPVRTIISPSVRRIAVKDNNDQITTPLRRIISPSVRRIVQRAAQTDESEDEEIIVKPTRRIMSPLKVVTPNSKIASRILRSPVKTPAKSSTSEEESRPQIRRVKPPVSGSRATLSSKSKALSPSPEDKTKIIKLLSDIGRFYHLISKTGAKDETYRANTFENAALVFASYDGPILKSELLRLTGIGPSVSDTILEIYRTGESTRLKDLIASHGDLLAIELDEDNIVKLFTSIKYVGTPMAKRLYALGYRTLDDLREDNYVPLTKIQKICLANYDDLQLSIPRREMSSWRKLFISLFDCDDYSHRSRPMSKNAEHFNWEICGSYRRGEDSSGDIDLIVMDVDLTAIVKLLAPYIVAELVSGPRKHGLLVRLKAAAPVRLLDLTMFSTAEWAYGLLHSTGSANFARLIRSHAKKFDCKLNSYSLTDENGTLIPADSEKEIFRLLKLEYLSPSQRGSNIAILTESGY
jgi:DNA polymerase beta